jgi:predicted peptidase
VVVEPEVVFVVDLEVSEPGVVFVAVVFVAVVSVADVAEPEASVDIAVAFDVLVPVSVVVVEVDSSGRPKFLAFPNVDHYATSSSSVEIVG